MPHKPFKINQISISYPHKICFEDFSVEVPYGSRIAIIGRNGSGKTSLLRLLRDTVKVPAGYVPQVIEDFENQNGRIHVFTGNYDDYIR